MKRYKLRKYQLPRMVKVNLEPEGFVCDSFDVLVTADPLKNMMEPENVEQAGQSYFEF